MTIEQILAELRAWSEHSPDDPRYPNNMRRWYVPELLDYIAKLERDLSDWQMEHGRDLP